MKFYTQQHPFYGGVDRHAKTLSGLQRITRSFFGGDYSPPGMITDSRTGNG